MSNGCRQATQSSRRILQMFSGPIAQFIRTDFPTDDIIPSVLTEDDETISRFPAVPGNNETMETFRAAAAEILQRAVSEGYDALVAETKLKALGCPLNRIG
jgi:hypothetical protein